MGVVCFFMHFLKASRRFPVTLVAVGNARLLLFSYSFAHASCLSFPDSDIFLFTRISRLRSSVLREAEPQHSWPRSVLSDSRENQASVSFSNITSLPKNEKKKKNPFVALSFYIRLRTSPTFSFNPFIHSQHSFGCFYTILSF